MCKKELTPNQIRDRDEHNKRIEKLRDNGVNIKRFLLGNVSAANQGGRMRHIDSNITEEAEPICNRGIRPFLTGSDCNFFIPFGRMYERE